MKLKQLLTKTFLVVACLGAGTSTAWAETGSVNFEAKNRCTYADGTLTTDNNAGNQYALAVADLSGLANIASATSITLEFNVTISGRLHMGIGDKAVRGTTANGSSQSTYNTDGIIMRYATKDGTYIRVNGGTNNSDAMNVSSHVRFTLDRKNKKYSYTIKSADGNTTYFSGNNIATTVSNATIVEAYTWVNSSSHALSSVSYSYELESYDYSVTAVDENGATIKSNLLSGTSSDGTDVTVDCPYAFQEGGVWYVKQDNSYTVSLNHFDNTQSVTYIADPTIVYYAEGEALNSNTASAGLSNGAYGHVAGGSGTSNKGKSIGSFGVGVYQATAYFVSADVNKNRGFYVRNSDLANANDANVLASVKTTTAGLYSTSQFLLSASTPLTVSGVTISGGKVNQSAEFDFIILRKLYDVSDASKVLGNVDYTTGYSTKWNDNPTTFTTGETAYYKFKNYNSGSGDAWNNWNVWVATTESVNKTILRADAVKNMGGESGTFVSNPTSNTFVADLNGATVELYSSLADAGDGTYTLTVKAVTTKADGTKMSPDYVYTETGYTDTNLKVHLSVDLSWLEILEQKTYPTSVSVPVGNSGFATYANHNYALDFSDVSGLTAYTATVSGNEVTFTPVTQVPTGTGLLLKGATASVPVIANAEAIVNNALYAPTANVAGLNYDQNDYYNYILTQPSGKMVGFYRANNNNVAAGKAYLRVSKNSSARQFSFIGLDGESEASGINAVNSNQISCEFYDLQGRRTSQPTKGLYIVNGKKVIIK